jgi:hypothetical protein
MKMRAGDIFNKMWSLRQEVKELQKAMDCLSEELGKDCSAYHAINKMYNEKSKEAIEFENKEFEEVEEVEHEAF